MNSLSEKDTLAIQDVVHHLHRCRTRPELKVLFQSEILPLLKADSAIYAWTDPDLLSPRLIDSINISKEHLAFINGFINEDPQAGSLLTHTHPVIARDIEIPRAHEVNREDPFREEPWRDDPFAKNETRFRDGYGFFSTAQNDVITLALRDSNLGAAIHRFLPCEKPWSVRDVRVLEQIRTPLLTAIKTIVLTEELSTQKSLVDILADSPTAIAVVDRNMQVEYSNAAWNELMSGGRDRQLDPVMEGILKQEKSKLVPSTIANSLNGRDPIFKLSDRDYQLCFAPLHGVQLENKDPWLLQVKPLVDLDAELGGQLKEAGLTKREMEACELLRQGIDCNEVAERLFISPHTVKTHLKRIHQKLGVHTRAQLVAALNR